MRKMSISILFWFLLLAVPFTALALSMAAYITDHLFELSSSLVTFFKSTTQIGRPWLLEMAERMPEVAGMIAGQIILLVILLVARMTENHVEE
jgi:hypothetical protein